MSSMNTASGVTENHSRCGNEQMFARVLEDLRPRLELIARHRGLGEADDLVQETLLAALIGFRENKFRGQSTIEGWIYGIFRNKIADQYRAQSAANSRFVSIGEDTVSMETVERAAALAASDPTLSIAVEEALEFLPARHWLVFMLNWREGLKTREIAPLLKLSPGRTGAILAEAKEMLRQRIAVTEESAAPQRLNRRGAFGISGAKNCIVRSTHSIRT